MSFFSVFRDPSLLWTGEVTRSPRSSGRPPSVPSPYPLFSSGVHWSLYVLTETKGSPDSRYTRGLWNVGRYDPYDRSGTRPVHRTLTCSGPRRRKDGKEVYGVVCPWTGRSGADGEHFSEPTSPGPTSSLPFKGQTRPTVRLGGQDTP